MSITADTTEKFFGKILNAALFALVLGLIIGYAVDKKFEFDAAIREAEARGFARGEAEGLKQGSMSGYMLGYARAEEGLSNEVQDSTFKVLDVSRFAAKRRYLSLVSVFGIFLSFYWVPFLISKNRRPTWADIPDFPSNFEGPSFRRDFIAKLLASIVMLIICLIFIPSYLWARLSVGYTDFLPTNRGLAELLVVVTGAAFALVLVRTIEFFSVRGSGTTRFWTQLVLTVVVSLLLYQLVGSLLAARRVALDETALKMLLLQVGISTGLAAYLAGSFAVSTVLALRSRTRLESRIREPQPTRETTKTGSSQI